MTKKDKKILFSIAFILLLMGSCTLCQYKKALKKQARDSYDNEYINKSFRGKIRRIIEQDNDPFKVVISIDDTSEFHISYGVTCVDQLFNDFVAEGDSVFKTSGSKYIKFCKPDKRCRDIELNFCGRFK
jgi:hypothetical protein